VKFVVPALAGIVIALRFSYRFSLCLNVGAIKIPAKAGTTNFQTQYAVSSQIRDPGNVLIQPRLRDGLKEFFIYGLPGPIRSLKSRFDQR
jgi:hypothetical protein